ncbi:aldose 1-epimerase family protein [Xanthobacter sp. KR7-65]|uniref:aldose 1-epimerase family protein n=1 Tax=Xanthobacter sp. KR7-65 TaxID=3156612 RepID=UPI0032B5ED99
MSGRVVTLASDGLSAEVSTLGAELTALRDGAGRALLWHGDSAVWAGRAPLLFPIVGELPDLALVHDGRRYPMKRHGFARISTFQVVEETRDRARFRLEPNEAIRAQYPFDFGLDVTYALASATLAITAEVRNPGPHVLPASFGFHPGFLWPLPYGGNRAEHRLFFEVPEPAPIHRPVNGLLSRATEPSPAADGVLAPDDALFERDALIFLDPRSRRIRYGVPGRPGLEISFDGMPQLGIWSKPGAPFLCIEPWAGYATPQGDARPFLEKPGLVHIPPGASHSFAMSVHWLPDVAA